MKEFPDEFTSIRDKLEHETKKSSRSALCQDLIGVITKISDHMLRNQKNVRKAVAETMGGRVLTLASERSERKGRKEGVKEGIDASVKKMAEYFMKQDPKWSKDDAVKQAEAILK